jgi:hypothetical protein
VLQPPEGVGVNDAIAVHLKSRSHRAGGLIDSPPFGFSAQASERSDEISFAGLISFTDRCTHKDRCAARSELAKIARQPAAPLTTSNSLQYDGLPFSTAAALAERIAQKAPLRQENRRCPVRFALQNPVGEKRPTAVV